MPKLNLFMKHTREQRQLPPPDTCVNTAGEHCWSGTPRKPLLLLSSFPMVPGLCEAPKSKASSSSPIPIFSATSAPAHPSPATSSLVACAPGRVLVFSLNSDNSTTLCAYFNVPILLVICFLICLLQWSASSSGARLCLLYLCFLVVAQSLAPNRCSLNVCIVQCLAEGMTSLPTHICSHETKLSFSFSSHVFIDLS